MSPQDIKEYWEPAPATYDEAMLKGNKAMSENKIDKALDFYKLAAQLVEDQYGPDDARIASALELAGTLLRDRGKFAEAEEQYAKAYEVLKKTARPNSPQLLALSKNYAIVLVHNFKLEEAKKVYPQIGTAAAKSGSPSGRKKHR
jgi:tetratricopeptide (TPR) repeat protein